MRLVGLACCLIVLGLRPAAAQDPAATLSLPQMAQCRASEHPRLPDKWRATFLMAPFTKAQLVLADIAHDGAVPAMRAKLYGLKHGSADLLVLGRRTYLLTSENGRPKACRDFGDTGWRPPRTNWLDRKAHCTGSAPVAETPVEWWKVPTTPAPLTNWMWLKSSDQSPFRLMFVRPDDTFAPLSWYAFSYQVRFEAAGETDLGELVALCRAAAPSTRGAAREALRQELAAMELSSSRAVAEIKQLMPDLDASCAGTALPRWPDNFAMSMLMTSLDVHETPFPTELIYKWGIKAQRTRMFSPPTAPTSAEDVLLIGPTGFQVVHPRKGAPICGGPEPGTLRPDWTSTGSCTCEAVINGTTPLTPYGSAQILNCPMTPPRVLWTWYALDGRPMVFMETVAGAEHVSLLTVADYYAWAPEHAAPDAAFAKPAQCDATQIAKLVPKYLKKSERSPCFSCHLGGDHR